MKEKFVNIIKKKAQNLKEDILILFNKKNRVKTGSILVALAVVMNSLSINPKRKENTKKENISLYQSFYLKDFNRLKLLNLDEENLEEKDENSTDDKVITEEKYLQEFDPDTSINSNKLDPDAKEDLEQKDISPDTTSESQNVVTDTTQETDTTPSINEEDQNDNMILDNENSEILSYNDYGFPVVKLNLNEKITISNEEKIAQILEYWDLTMEQFNIIKATCRHEGGPKYFDGFTIINNVYNRTISKRWSPNENQRNLFYQITRSGQYNSYLKGYYKQFLDLTPEECPAVQAVIDFLYVATLEKPVIMHNYLSFSQGSGHQFTETKIRFRNPILDEDFLTKDFIWMSEEELWAISEAGSFANFYLNQLEIEEETPPVNDTFNDNNNYRMVRIRRL